MPPSRPPSLNYTACGGGVPLVLVHGIGSELCAWEPVLDRLAKSFEAIAVDLPGFGHSPPLPDGAEPTPAALAAAVGGLLDELGYSRAHVAGNSLGGWVALELARQGRALSVTALCPAGLWAAPVLGEGVLARGRAHHAVRRLRLLLPVLLASPRLRQLALSPFVAHPERVPYHAAWRMVRSYGRATAYDATSTAMRRGYFSRSQAQELSVPVTLAFGERDRLIRPARIQAPGARTVLLPDCGHIPMWDDPELVGDVILQTAGRAATAIAR